MFKHQKGKAYPFTRSQMNRRGTPCIYLCLIETLKTALKYASTTTQDKSTPRQTHQYYVREGTTN